MTSFSTAVTDLELYDEPLDAGQIVTGAPVVSHRLISESDDKRVLRGVWQITPGVVTDTEDDEMFVVIFGSATIELLDAGRTLQVGPGDVCVFAEGERTRWTVHQTLRKVYQITEPA
ncbi:MAG TPA: cupin domain-containing protein [Micromonosporaceae bacterium]